jgi:iron complex transport system ATP-binding protein
MTLLALDQVTVRRGPRRVLDAVSFSIRRGEVVALLGPNGAGKSSLLRAALGLLPAQGEIWLGDDLLQGLTPRQRALRLAYVPQERAVAWSLDVGALVALGRQPHRATPQADAAAVAAALEAMDMAGFERRPATELSGGERARALIARALAQEAPLLLADEPTAGLDPAHQLGLMARFRALAAQGSAVLVAIHDLGLAARWCDRVILLHRGRVVAAGPPAATLTPDTLARVYGVTAFHGSDAGGPLLLPTGLA